MDSAALPGKGERMTARFLSGGTQNEIYEPRRGDEMRHPDSTAQSTAGPGQGHPREWRIIEALDGTDVPHTKATGCATTRRAWRPFYLMGFVDGWSPMAPTEVAGAVRRRPPAPRQD